MVHGPHSSQCRRGDTAKANLGRLGVERLIDVDRVNASDFGRSHGAVYRAAKVGKRSGAVTVGCRLAAE